MIARQRLLAQVSVAVALVVLVLPEDDFEPPQPAARSATDTIVTNATTRGVRVGIPASVSHPGDRRLTRRG